MSAIQPPVTEQKVLDALREKGVTNLGDLAQKAVEQANSLGTADKVITDAQILIHSAFVFVD